MFPNKAELWRKAADLEKAHGTSGSLLQLLERAVNSCPHSEIFWLMAAKECWQTNNDVDGARKILGDAFKANPKSEQVWLAAVKLELENGQIEAAKQLMKRARDLAGTERVGIFFASLVARDLKRDCKTVKVCASSVGDDRVERWKDALLKLPTSSS